MWRDQWREYRENDQKHEEPQADDRASIFREIEPEFEEACATRRIDGIGALNGSG